MASRIQSKSTSTGSATSTTIAATFSAAVTSGNLVCGFVTWGNDTTTLLTNVTDDKSNTYTIVRRTPTAGSGQTLASFYCANITNAPTIITATFSSAIGYRGILFHEVNGVNTLDVETGQYQATPGTGTDAITSGAITTTSNGEYIIGGVVDSSGSQALPYYTAGTGYGKVEEAGASGATNCCTEDLIQSSAGSIAATFTQSLAHKQTTLIMTFKQSAGGGTVVFRKTLSSVGTKTGSRQIQNSD